MSSSGTVPSLRRRPRAFAAWVIVLCLFGVGVARFDDGAVPAAELTPRLPPQGLPRLALNKVSEHELRLLPGIGPRIAARIVAHRTEYGPFKEVGDLTHIRGIGAKTLGRLSPFLAIEDGAHLPSQPVSPR